MDTFFTNVEPQINLSPITFKHCLTELKRQGLERLLSAIYKREVSINLLLVEGGASPAVLEALRYRNIGSIAELLIDDLKSLVCDSEGGVRRYQIIERYYGLDGNMPARLSAMAAKHGVSRERVRQIKERALMSLRYKKQVIERRLGAHSARLLSRRPPGLRNEQMSGVDSVNEVKLLDHRQLLIMHDSQVPWTEEQSKALFELSWAKRARILGCAGSGKTALALATARRLAQSGERTLLTCFSRALADTLTNHLGTQENLVVASFHSLCLRIGKQAGITTPGGWNNRAWLEKFPDVLRKSMLKHPEYRFDSIIVDDAHEFRDNWWTSIEASLVNPDSSRLICFADSNSMCNPAENELPRCDHEATLSINLRSPTTIAPMLNASFVSNQKMRFSRSATVPIEFYRCETDDEMCKTLDHVFLELVEQGSYLASDVAIVTPRVPRFSSAASAKLRGGSRIIRRQSDIPNHALLCRAHTFKGLERKVVVLIDLDNKFAALSDDEIRSFVYMTFSRFVDKLVILGSLEAWKKIESLTPKPPIISSSFQPYCAENISDTLAY